MMRIDSKLLMFLTLLCRTEVGFTEVHLMKVENGHRRYLQSGEMGMPQLFGGGDKNCPFRQVGYLYSVKHNRPATQFEKIMKCAS